MLIDMRSVTYYQTIPEQMQETCADDNGDNVDQDSKIVARNLGYAMEDDLSHGIVRADIEHINLPVWMESKVKHSCY